MKILALPRYGRLGASSRLRTYQYLPLLREAGMQIDVAPLLDNDYVGRMYAGRGRVSVVLKGYADRISRLVSSKDYDLVWTEKELLPWVPSFIERAMRPGTRLVVDYDDALFHRYDQHANALVRRMFGEKIERVMRGADLVLAGNDYLADRAKAAGASEVEWLPTVVDLIRYAPHSQSRAVADESSPMVVGWIGSPSTAGYLKDASAPLAELADLGLIRCVAIGASPGQVVGTPFQAQPWQEDTEVDMLSQLDVGIMPLKDALWERGKCGYKLIQYMACGLPVVASPVGVNTTIVRQGVEGYLARDASEWKDAIVALARDPERRISMGKRGRRRVEETYSLQAQAPRLIGMLSNLSTHSGKRS